MVCGEMTNNILMMSENDLKGLFSFSKPLFDKLIINRVEVF